MELKLGEERYTIRQGQLMDYPFIFGLVKETIFPLVAAYAKPDEAMFRQRFESDYQDRILLLDGAIKVGFYQLEQEGDILIVKGIFLDKAYRGKGIGQALMKHFEEKGAGRIQLQVWDNNPAVNFYLKLGYKIVKTESHKHLMEKVVELIGQKPAGTELGVR